MNENETKMVIQNRKMLSFQLDVKDEGVFSYQGEEIAIDIGCQAKV